MFFSHHFPRQFLFLQSSGMGDLKPFAIGFTSDVKNLCQLWCIAKDWYLFLINGGTVARPKKTSLAYPSTHPTLGNGKSSSNIPWFGICYSSCPEGKPKRKTIWWDLPHKKKNRKPPSVVCHLSQTKWGLPWLGRMQPHRDWERWMGRGLMCMILCIYYRCVYIYIWSCLLSLYMPHIMLILHNTPKWDQKWRMIDSIE